METLQVIDTGQNVDSTEWCPVLGLTDILACAVYHLVDEEHAVEGDDTPKRRIGRVLLYHCPVDSTPELAEWHRVECPEGGVLDMKWLCTPSEGGAAVLVVALSCGTDTLQCIEVGEALPIVDSELCLSLDLSDRAAAGGAGSVKLAVSDSSGAVTVLDSDSSAVLHRWTAHSFPAWIVAFDCHDTDFLFSGGDDCRLKGWDLRAGTERAMFSSKRHSMGVCSLQSHPTCAHLFASGSYDESIFVWDRRRMKAPLHEAEVGGGVWRLKWHPHDDGALLAACMHNHFQVLRLADDGLSVAQVYEQHESLAYGASWCFHPRYRGVGGDPSLVATCSFYDSRLRLWTAPSHSEAESGGPR